MVLCAYGFVEMSHNESGTGRLDLMKHEWEKLAAQDLGWLQGERWKRFLGQSGSLETRHSGRLSSGALQQHETALALPV